MLKSKLFAIFFVLMLPFAASAQSSDQENIQEGYHFLLECNAAYMVHMHYIRIYHQYNEYTNAPENTLLTQVSNQLAENLMRNQRLLRFTARVLGATMDLELQMRYFTQQALSVYDYPTALESINSMIKTSEICGEFERGVEQTLLAPAPPRQ